MSPYEKLVRRTALIGILCGIILLIAAMLPLSFARSVAGNFDHASDVTSDRMVRFRVACTMISGLSLVLGATFLKERSASLGTFLESLLAECRNWKPGQQIRRTHALLQSPGTLYFVAFLTMRLSGVVMRFRYLFGAPQYDEAYSFVNFARRPFYQAIMDYSSTNNHLLNTAFMHLCYLIFGQQDWAMRLPVLIAGILLLPASYFFARKTLGHHSALIGTALVATSPMLIHYSTEARGYIMVTLASFWTADRLIAAILGNRRIDWIMALAAAVAGFMAIPIMIYPFTAIVLWALFTKHVPQTGQTANPDDVPLTNRPLPTSSGQPQVETSGTCPHLTSILIWTASVLILSLLFYLPAWVISGTAAYDQRFTQSLSLTSWLQQYVPALVMAVQHASPFLCFHFSHFRLEFFIPLAATIFGIIGGISLIWNRPNTSPSSLSTGSRWLFIIIPAITLAAFAVQRIAPPPRIFVFLAPWWLLLIGHGIHRGIDFLTHRQVRHAEKITPYLSLAVVLCGLLLVFTHTVPYYPARNGLVQDVPNVARFLKTNIQPNHRVYVLNPWDKPLEYELIKLALPVHQSLQLNGTAHPGEDLWLVKPRLKAHLPGYDSEVLTIPEALKQIPGTGWGQFVDTSALPFRGHWEMQQQWSQLELWKYQRDEKSSVH